MRKCAVFAPSGWGRPKRGLGEDERGITPVIGAVFVLAFVIMAISVYIGQVVPSYLRYNEAEHYNAVRSVFIDLQQAILSHKGGTIDIPMSPDPTPIFTLSPTSSTVEVTPARWVKRFQPSDDTYVDEGDKDGIFGDDEVLWVRSYKPPGGAANNSRIYTKFNMAAELPGISATNIEEAWLVLYCENISKFMGTPWGDSNYEVSESGSWRQTDWSGGLGVDFSSSENIDWENFPGEIRLQFQVPATSTYYLRGELISSVYDAGSAVLWGFNKGIYYIPTGANIYVYVRFSNDGVFDDSETMEGWREITHHNRFDFGTVRARYIQYEIVLYSDSDRQDTSVFRELWLLNVDQFYLPALPLKVEVREVTGTWSEDTLTWNLAESDLTIGETIKAGDWPNDDNHGVKENEVWYTWDVTSWVRSRVSAGGDVSFLLQACYENSTLDRYGTFSSKEREALDGLEPPDVDQDDVDDKTTGHPPYLKPHLTVIYENGNRPGPPVYDNWGAFIECGSVRFDTNYREFPNNSFIFESGALLQQQYGFAYEFMISDPGLVVGERLDDDAYHDNIAIYLNRYRIVNRDKLTSTTDSKLFVTVRENFDDYDDSWTITSAGPMRHVENLLITIRSDFEWPWKYYLRDMTGRWNGSASKGGLTWWVDYYDEMVDPSESFWSGNIVEFMAKLYIDRNIRLYFWGQVENSSVKDIYFYDRTYDVEVQIGV